MRASTPIGALAHFLPRPPDSRSAVNGKNSAPHLVPRFFAPFIGRRFPVRRRFLSLFLGGRAFFEQWLHLASGTEEEEEDEASPEPVARVAMMSTFEQMMTTSSTRMTAAWARLSAPAWPAEWPAVAVNAAAATTSEGVG